MQRHDKDTVASRIDRKQGLFAAVVAGLLLTCATPLAWSQSDSRQNYQLKELQLPKLPVAPLLRSQKQTEDQASAGGGPPRDAIGTYQLIAHPLSAYAYLSDTPGPATQKNHQGWFEVLGLSEEIATLAKPSSQRGATSADVRPLTLTKPIDAASVHLRDYAVAGRHLESATVAITNPNGADVYRVTLYEVLVSGVRVRFDKDGVREEIDLVYDRIRWSFNVYDQTNTSRGTISRCWNVATNQPC
jgi:type VI secretion system Hcp family effector